MSRYYHHHRSINILPHLLAILVGTTLVVVVALSL